jgi:thioredoxin 1
MPSKNVVEITDHNFQDEVIAAATPTLVDFHAVWCAPCRVIGPHVEAIADEYAGRLRVGKCDVDANPAVAAEFDVRNLPTLLVFRQGKVVARIVGAVPRTKLDELLSGALR